LSRKILVGRRMWERAIALRRQLRLREVDRRLGRHGLRDSRRGLDYRRAHYRVGNGHVHRRQENRGHRRHQRGNGSLRNGRRGNGRGRGNRSRG
jgi:hypothetical protein